MKFSKIACVALLSASISTVALANSIELVNLGTAQTTQKTKEAAYQAVISAVKELKTIGYANLKNWNGKNTDQGENGLSAELNTKIYNALEKIKKVKTDIAPDSSNLEIKSGESKLVITDRGEIKLLIKGDGLEAVHSGDSNTGLTLVLDDFANAHKNEIVKIFNDKNEELWNKLIAEFTNKHNELKNERAGKINEAAVELAKATGDVADPIEKYTAFIENKSTIENAIKADIAAKEKAVKDAQGKVDEVVKKVDTSKVVLKSKDNAGISEQENKIKGLKTQLNQAKLKDSNHENNKEKATVLKAAIGEGVQLKRKNAEATLLTKDDIDAILAGGAGKVTHGDFDHADAASLTGDTEIGKVLNALIEEATKGSGYIEAAETEIGKVTTEIGKVKTANENLATSNKLMTDTDKTIATITSSEEIAEAKFMALDV
ncbi:hypothetical protein, partial [Campylobacter mucosalis]